MLDYQIHVLKCSKSFLCFPLNHLCKLRVFDPLRSPENPWLAKMPLNNEHTFKFIIYIVATNK